MKIRFPVLIILSICLSATSLLSQPTNEGYPVVIRKDTIFYIKQRLGSFTPQDRANALSRRLEGILKDYSFSIDSLTIESTEGEYFINYKAEVISVIGSRDTLGTGLSQAELADSVYKLFKEKLLEHHRSFSAKRVIRDVGLTLVVIVLLALIIKLLSILFRKIHAWIDSRKERIFRSIRFRNYEFMTVERQLFLAHYLLRIVKIGMIVLAVLISFPVIFSIFPATEGITRKIIELVWSPFRGILLAIWDYLPNVISILLIYFVFKYLIRFIAFLAREVERGALVIPGFYHDWAQPTFNIVKFVLYLFMFIIIFPYLPGSDSPIFRGVSVFLGLLLSLGSTSAVANTIAGLVITYMRPFKVGDRIKVEDMTGDVVEKTLLVTRIRTIKNEDITIPNSKILTGYTINYSTPTLEQGLIIHTTVTIGYDAPWRKVHQLLLSAAESTGGVAKDPKPFVLQTSLDDFYISYQINAYIKNAHEQLKIKSELHQNIQDQFNKGGVEIMSPHYRSERDGNPSTIPPQEKENPEG